MIWRRENFQAALRKKNRFLAISIAANEKFVLTGEIALGYPSAGNLTLWDLNSRQVLRVFEGHGAYVKSVCLADNMVFSGSHDSSIKAWDIETGKNIVRFDGHTDTVSCLERMPTSATAGKNDVIVSCGWDGALKMWDARASNSSIMSTSVHSSFVTCLQLSEDGTERAVTSSLDGSLKLWSVKMPKKSLSGTYGTTEMKAIDTLLVHDGVSSFVYDEDFRIVLLVGSYALECWNWEDRTLQWRENSSVIKEIGRSIEHEKLIAANNCAVTFYDYSHHSRYLQLRSRSVGIDF
jgi:WD40 repeat protein